MMKAIVFTSNYCPYCRVFKRTVERLKNELDGLVKFDVVNVDENRELAEKYEVMMVPTVVITKGDEVVGGFMGYADYKTAREAILEQILASPKSNYKN